MHLSMPSLLLANLHCFCSSDICSFLKSTGHKCAADVHVSAEKWGRNELDIPVPSFFDLYTVCMITQLLLLYHENLFIRTSSLKTLIMNLLGTSRGALLCVSSIVSLSMEFR